MATTYQAKGYNLYRKATKNVFTHAVVFMNYGSSDQPEGILEACFNTTYDAALKDIKLVNRLSHLKFLEVVEVEVAA
jgi:hypothetical protein